MVILNDFRVSKCEDFPREFLAILKLKVKVKVKLKLKSEYQIGEGTT